MKLKTSPIADSVKRCFSLRPTRVRVTWSMRLYFSTTFVFSSISRLVTCSPVIMLTAEASLSSPSCSIIVEFILFCASKRSGEPDGYLNAGFTACVFLKAWGLTSGFLPASSFCLSFFYAALRAAFSRYSFANSLVFRSRSFS